MKKISVQSIVAEIEHGKFLSKEKMLQMSMYWREPHFMFDCAISSALTWIIIYIMYHVIVEDRNKDDDIMATSSTLSLKCPVRPIDATTDVVISICLLTDSLTF